MERRRAVAIALGAGLVAAAVRTELSKPPTRRSWHGTTLGFVPYDFRPPTFARVRSRWWNPGDPRLLTPRAFGVGWDVNVARLLGR